jgi:hypothetical protein
MFLFVDNLLGENDVERWLGSIEQLQAPSGGKTPDELKEEVRRHADEGPTDRWVLAQRTDRSGNYAIVSTNLALKRIDHPFASQHLDIKVSRGMKHLANNPESQELDAAEDELVALLGADAIYVGRITEAGVRHVHFVCETPSLIEERVSAWADKHRRFGMSYSFAEDPSWEFRRELMG